MTAVLHPPYLAVMLKTLERLAQPIAARIGVEPGNFIGICLAIFSGLAIMAVGAVGKQLGRELHPFAITFLRSAMMVAILWPLFGRRGYHRIKPTRHGLQFLNGLVFTGAMMAWFWALPRVPFDLVAAIGFTSQLFAIVGAILFLGEQSRPWRWGALGVGFIGAMIILRPGYAPLTPGVIATIISAVLFSTNRLIIKVIATSDNPETSVIWQAIWATLLTLPVALYVWTTPSPSQLFWLVLLAVLTVMSHYALAWALRLADIGAIEPTTFVRLIWAAMLGFIFSTRYPTCSRSWVAWWCLGRSVTSPAANATKARRGWPPKRRLIPIGVKKYRLSSPAIAGCIARQRLAPGPSGPMRSRACQAALSTTHRSLGLVGAGRVVGGHRRDHPFMGQIRFAALGQNGGPDLVAEPQCRLPAGGLVTIGHRGRRDGRQDRYGNRSGTGKAAGVAQYLAGAADRDRDHRPAGGDRRGKGAHLERQQTGHAGESAFGEIEQPAAGAGQGRDPVRIGGAFLGVEALHEQGAEMA